MIDKWICYCGKCQDAVLVDDRDDAVRRQSKHYGVSPKCRSQMVVFHIDDGDLFHYDFGQLEILQRDLKQKGGEE